MVLQPGPVDGKDAAIQSNYPDSNFVTSQDFVASAWTNTGVFLIQRSLIQFDLTAIPSNSTVINAVLSLSTNLNSGNYELDAGANTSYLLRILTSWDQSLVTWNNQPPFSVSNPVILPQSTSDTEHYYVDVTSHVQDMVSNPLANFGWMFKLQTEQTYRDLVFASSNNTIALWRPKLTVVYCVLPNDAGTISGPDSICQGAGGKIYTVPPIVNATYYIWNLPPGATIINGAGTNSITVSFSLNAVSGNIIVAGSDTCSTGNPSSPFPVTVETNDTAGISITASMNNVCAGTSVTFTATPTNPGTTPIYQWKVNGINSGTNSTTFTYTPLNGDFVTCILTSSLTVCITNNPATSNGIAMIVNPNQPVSVTIAASQNPVCAGNSVTFTATATNGGSAPSYQWKVNGAAVGSNSPGYSYIPGNGDIVTCVLTSNVTCPTGNPATSNPITMTVNPNLAVTITISASANPFCQGSSVTFNATPVNGDGSPTYQWKVNGVNAGVNNPDYTFNPSNGDLVTCVLNSSIACPLGNPATSNILTMIENSNLPAGITIAASSNPFCPGSSVTFTATPINGGTTPTYQWKVNGVNAGPNSSAFSYSPANNDSVRCVMTSDLNCVTGNPASSAEIIMSGTLAPIVTFTSCFDTITTVNAKPIKLKGGIPLGGTYSGPGVNSPTGIFTPAIAGVGTKMITYSYTNAVICTASKNMHIIVQAAPVFTCGNNLTDIRDNKVYATVQIGSQCWMAANLNFGTILASTQDQRDNCVSEKYCYNDNPINCTNQGGLYQWDELMLYDNTPADQGFCPPAWHIPSENEWNTLFAMWINNGFAGSPLKYSGYSGFNALLSGARHINKNWDFQGFATFFWSSSGYGGYKVWVHGMNEEDPSVSIYPSLKINAFSVRCLHD